jgi:catechol 2,3-dioxygenase-like lactoylglutathione lyase family enzyme
MTPHNSGLTQGVHHVGLTVKDLAVTLDFFVAVLGFKKLGEIPDYPAAFVTDGTTKITLWQALAEEKIAFDRRSNIGLHHLALKIDGENSLRQIHGRLKEAPGVTIEFAPEPLNGGPAKHMMLTEPGGIRIELITPA